MIEKALFVIERVLVVIEREKIYWKGTVGDRE